jgi:hypothetical protein
VKLWGPHLNHIQIIAGRKKKEGGEEGKKKGKGKEVECFLAFKSPETPWVIPSFSK